MAQEDVAALSTHPGRLAWSIPPLMKRSCPEVVDFWTKITVRLVPLDGAQVLSVVGATVVTVNHHSNM